MNIHKKYKSKERLFEVFAKVCHIRLNEAMLSDVKRRDIIDDFVLYVANELNLENNIPNIVISDDEFEAENMKSFGKYTPELNEIRIVIINRNLADILRTLAHELVHCKQRIENKLNDDSNITGSSEENEANAIAGILMRNYGKINPSIFE